MSEASPELHVPEEPVELKKQTRSFLEESPERGAQLIEDGEWISALLWDTWGEQLAGAGMDYERFLSIVRGYKSELRLWVVGERPWDHCIAALAGRLLRRLPAGDRSPSLKICR